MKTCGDFIQLHENEVGSIAFCSGCDHYHLYLKGLLSIVSQDELNAIDKGLRSMKADVRLNQDIRDPMTGVQIKLTTKTFLCLKYREILQAEELIGLGFLMKEINESVLS